MYASAARRRYLLAIYLVLVS